MDAQLRHMGKASAGVVAGPSRRRRIGKICRDFLLIYRPNFLTFWWTCLESNRAPTDYEKNEFRLLFLRRCNTTPEVRCIAKCVSKWHRLNRYGSPSGPCPTAAGDGRVDRHAPPSVEAATAAFPKSLTVWEAAATLDGTWQGAGTSRTSECAGSYGGRRSRAA